VQQREKRRKGGKMAGGGRNDTSMTFLLVTYWCFSMVESILVLNIRSIQQS
jgi:hypothetical protein